MTFLLLLIPALACALVVWRNMRAEKLVREGHKDQAVAPSLFDDYFIPVILVACAIVFYAVAYMVFPVK